MFSFDTLPSFILERRHGAPANTSESLRTRSVLVGSAVVFKLMKLRFFGAAALLVAVTIGGGIATASTAQACSINTHCYGETYASHAGVAGDFVVAAPSCLGIPSGNFVTDEIWLTSSGDTYWVENGYMQLGSNLNVGGITTAGRYGTWGDNRPNGGGYHMHVLENNPSLSGADIQISEHSSSSWDTIFDGYTGESTANPLRPVTVIYGSETSSASAHSHYAGTGLEYETGTGAVWHTGLPGYSTNIDSPETFAWTSGTTNYTAGVSC
jgi:hypothetical protein